MAARPGIVLYDFLLVRGGAERLTLTLLRGLPGIDLCIGYRARESFADQELEGLRVIDLHASTAIAGWRSIKVMRAFRYRTAFLRDYAWVLYSGTNAPLAVHNHPGGRNILYCHTVPRFVYDLRDYYLGRYPFWLRPALRALMAYVQPRYEAAIAKMDLIVVNSENVRGRVRRYLGRESVVVHPPVDVDRFRWRSQGDYYLSTARLEPFKRVDLVVEAFRRLPHRKLVVASGGSELRRLRELAAGARNIEFADWLDDAALVDLVARCIATVYVARDEDFGMSPVESMAAGKPVIGVAEGGLLETVIDGETGVLAPADPRVEDLVAAIESLPPPRALAMREACERRAAQFSRERFLERMREVLGVGG